MTEAKLPDGVTKIGKGKYRVRVSTGRKRASGTYIEVTEVFGTRQAAVDALKSMRSRYGGRAATRGQIDPTFADFATRWLEDQKLGGKAPHTLHGYRLKLNLYVLPTLGRKRLSQIRGRDLENLYASMKRTLLVRNESGEMVVDPRPLSSTTKHQVHAILSSAFEDAVRQSILDEAPTRRAKVPPVEPHRIKAPSGDQVAIALAASATLGVDHALVVQLAAATGARRGELAALRWSDIDLDAGTLTVARALTAIRGVRDERPTKTKNERTMTVDPQTVAVLTSRLQRARTAASDFGVPMDPAGFVLATVTDEHPEPDSTVAWQPYMISDVWKAVRASDQRLEGVRLHDLRHFHATELMDGGVPIASVAERLGHAGGAVTTMKVYGHGTSRADVASAAIIAKAMKGNVNAKKPRTKPPKE